MNVITMQLGYAISRISLSSSEASQYAPVLAHLTGISISKVERTIQKVGRVVIFEATPYQSFDPPLVYTDYGFDALIPYYDLWRRGVSAHRELFGTVLFPRQRVQEVVKHFKRNTPLDTDEVNFAIHGILRFQNEVLMRG